MKTISILNLKGGVAKTFTAANMAYELYRRGYKVLLLDNDKQGNLSKAYGRYDAESVAPMTRLLSGEWKNPEEIIQHTDYEGMDIITANMSLFGAAWNLTKEENENQTERYSACKLWHYDYCIIDNPPDIGLNVINALAITDEVIVPVKLDNYALEGLDIVAEQIEDARQFNPALYGKGAKERETYLTAAACMHLKDYLDSRSDSSDALFVGLKAPHERLTVSGVEELLRKLGKSTGISKVHPHRFRRTMATNILNKGMPIEEVKEILGHVKLDTTLIYCQVNRENVRHNHKKYMSA